MTERLGAADRPLKIAIIGAGPAGLYAAESLLRRRDISLTIDVFNRFPTPFGLVRDGVAPDHQSIKAVARVLERILADPRVRYFGNVTYGVDIHHRELKRHYDQLVYAVGAQADRRMSIPGEELPNSHPAISFVGWYNGHPDYRELPVDLSVERAVVVGNGNVAMDVSRILATSPDQLARTDIADHALERLRQSRIREVVVLGRRGPAQASFTTPELRELGRLEGVDAIVDPRDLELDAVSQADMEEDRTATANLRILREYAARTRHPGPRRILLRFLASPVEIIGTDGRITALKAERNELVVDANGALRSRGTGQFETIETGLVLRSIGYRTVPIEGVPFDPATSTINNIAGQVVHPNTGEVVRGEYVVGWAKRGPTGLIGNNKPDSAATVEAMLADLPLLQRLRDGHRDPSAIEALLRERGVDHVTYPDWQVLDAHEVAAGRAEGRPRKKVTTVPEMMAIIHQGR
ncbi:MAG TPA: FAD-dependent oxidoreductase [Actinomycetota bacterium]|nr:FAD-dependent oxidoreductase [Actinomycetota bacterium]